MTRLLELRGVRKAFGGVVAVRDVDLSVETGSITAIIGPNGAGKTTLFNLVSGFEQPDAGSVWFDGLQIDGLKAWQIARRGLARSFQTPAGFPALSVWENLMVAGTDSRHESLLRGLIGRSRRREVETDRAVSRLIKELDLTASEDSAVRDSPPGDVKLIDFARLLMFRPRMLLLDEPASGVDPRSIGRLSDLIRGLRDSGMTVLIIDHNLGFVLGIADVVHVMANGAVIAAGTPDVIVRNDQVMEVYLGRKA